MSSHLDRIVYLNGTFMPGHAAQISIFDRGLLFADAVYEGLGVIDGHIIDFDRHMARLERSLGELHIGMPLGRDDIRAVLQRLVADNALSEGFLYLHITRGTADRDYVYADDLTATVFAFVQPKADETGPLPPKGVTLCSHPDLRWKRRDIKTTNLLGQVIAKQAAHAAGAYEALLVDDSGYITEGGATSFFIVREKTLFARPVTTEILHGVTRQAMLAVADAQGLQTTVARFTLEEAYAADEAFITGSSTYIEPVIAIDEKTIGDGAPGPVTLALLEQYLSLARTS